MKWSAIITTYNSGSVIGRALESILSLEPDEKPVDIVVVDNDSKDHTAEVLKDYADRVNFVRNKTNLGLSKANNIGAGQARGDSLFFLNPDTEVLPGAVRTLFSFQESHPRAALLGPGMEDWNGVLQPTARTWPTPPVIAARRTFIGGTPAGARLSAGHLRSYHREDSPVRPHWLVGAALWLTPEGRKRVGLMSESYFLYFEDVEWCHRAWRRGMEVWYVPEARIRHVCSRESSRRKGALGLHLRSMTRFLLTHPLTALGLGPGGGDE
ncbi:MAG TPA: glycosyltransferase family 2 protein [Candidatus Sabulitectum sp.]|nr:glycosyltransferase family 2 protein [Candidatus Sabulitectum sp.]